MFDSYIGGPSGPPNPPAKLGGCAPRDPLRYRGAAPPGPPAIPGVCAPWDPLQKCIMIIVHACTMIIVHACAMVIVQIIVHACTMIIVHAPIVFFAAERHVTKGGEGGGGVGGRNVSHLFRNKRTLPCPTRDV